MRPKRLLPFLPTLLFLCGYCRAATPVTVTGNIKNILGNAATSGSFLRIVLRNYAGWVPVVPGAGLIPVTQDIYPDANGNISTPLWGNDVITPGPNLTYYTFEFHSTQQTLVSEDFFVPISLVTYPASSPSIFNFLTATPMSIPPPSPANAVLQNPLGGQNIIQPVGTFLELGGSPIASFTGTSTAGNCLVDLGNFKVGDFGGGCGVTGSSIITTNNSFTGSNTFPVLNNVRYIDGTKYALTAAGINQAFTDCASTVCEVVVPFAGNYSDTSITPAAGDVLQFGPGTYTYDGIICPSSTTAEVEGCAIYGAGRGKTILHMKNGANIDGITVQNFAELSNKVITTATRTSNIVTATCQTTCNFANGDKLIIFGLSPLGGYATVTGDSGFTFTYTLNGSNGSSTAGIVANTYGVNHLQIANITIDGNSANNATGNCVSIFGRTPDLLDDEIENCPVAGLWTEGGEVSSALNFGGGDTIEGHFTDILIHNVGGTGLMYRGPHDSKFTDVIVDEASPCSDMWYNFYLTSGNFFLCGTGAANYGLIQHYFGSGQITNLNTESIGVLTVASPAFAAPSPNLYAGVLAFAGSTVNPAIEFDGYGNRVTASTVELATVNPGIYFNGGAGTIDADIINSAGTTAPWVKFSAAARANSDIRLWGISACPAGGCIQGSTNTSDTYFVRAQNSVVLNQQPPVQTPFQLVNNLTSVSSSAFGFQFIQNNNSGVDDSSLNTVAVEVTPNNGGSGGHRPGVGLEVGDGIACTFCFEVGEDIEGYHLLGLGLISSDTNATDLEIAVPAFDSGAAIVVCGVGAGCGTAKFSVTHSGNVAGQVISGTTINATSGFQANGTAGFTGSKVAGSCTFIISEGIITNVTGC